MYNKRRGISLIILVITIIVIIILAGAVILSLASNNPISQAAKATFLSDLRNFETELDLYEGKQFLDKMGGYDLTKLQADETSVIYDGNVDTTKTMYDLMPALGKATKYAGQFKVIDGKLVFQGSDTNQQNWATEVGTEVSIVGEPTVTMIPPDEAVVVSGTDIVYTVKFSSNAPLTIVDLTGKVEVLDNSNVTLVSQPVITIGTVSGTAADTTRQVDITIKTDSLANGSYKLKIKAGAATNANNVSTVTDKISLIGFDVDSTPPTNPTLSANPTEFTSGNVNITINYSLDSIVKEYSLDGITWNNYTVPVVITTNNTTVYARGKKSSGIESGVATLTVSNIDRVAPVVSYGLNGASAIQTASTTVTVTDAAGSGVDAATLEYVWDTQNTVTPVSGWTTFTNGQALLKAGVTGTYYLWVKAVDNAGNSVVSKTNGFVTDNTAPTIVYGTNGGTNATQVGTTITASDIGTGINTSSLQYIWDTQNVTVPVSGWTIFTNGATVTKTGDGIYYLWVKAVDNAGNLVTTKSNIFVIGNVAIPVSTVQTENKTFSGATIGFSYNDPVIPAGFVAVDTDDAKWSNLVADWNKGLVIQDLNGNQFVWVPVDGTNVPYAKWCTTSISYANTSEDTLPAGFNVNNITTTYKGFYIARYQAAFDYNGGDIRVASKKSVSSITTNWTRESYYTGYLWNFVNYGEAKFISESMASKYGYDTTKIGTNLITGTEWDTTMKWIQNSGKSVVDGKTWGNYSDSISPANVSGYGNLHISGYSEYWKAKNIYDLGGNCWEWTSEKYMTDYIWRGGAYNHAGASSPPARRAQAGESISNYCTTFRVALYLK